MHNDNFHDFTPPGPRGCRGIINGLLIVLLALVLTVAAVNAWAGDHPKTPEAPEAATVTNTNTATGTGNADANALSDAMLKSTLMALGFGAAAATPPAAVAEPHPCFIPIIDGQGRGHSNLFWSRPAGLELNQPCWEWFRLREAVDMLKSLDLPEADAVALTLIVNAVGQPAPTFTAPQCEERERRVSDACEQIISPKTPLDR